MPFGSGLGNVGSTSNRGAITPFCACAAATRCTTLCASASATSSATNVPPISRLRLMISLRGLLGHKLLHSLTVMLLSRVHVALRVYGDTADGEELSRVTAAASERADGRQRVALQDMDLLVVSIGDEHVSLLRVVREREIPRRAMR